MEMRYALIDRNRYRLHFERNPDEAVGKPIKVFTHFDTLDEANDFIKSEKVVRVLEFKENEDRLSLKEKK